MTIQSFSSDQFNWKKDYGFTGTAEKVNLIGNKKLNDKIAIKFTKTGKVRYFDRYSTVWKGGRVISVTYMPSPKIPNRNSEEILNHIFKQGIKIVINI